MTTHPATAEALNCQRYIMPIKPENKARYPANWKQIRAQVLERAQHKCEQCGVANRARIVRGTGPDADTYMTHDAEVYDADTGEYLGLRRMSDYHCNGNVTDIVLTIAHLDHQPENCVLENLRAWCQRCHLRYDARHHAANAAATRRARKAIAELF
jgi:5-methylcytosine-specific restriction endonuclease McrA